MDSPTKIACYKLSNQRTDIVIWPQLRSAVNPTASTVWDGRVLTSPDDAPDGEQPDIKYYASASKAKVRAPGEDWDASSAKRAGPRVMHLSVVPDA